MGSTSTLLLDPPARAGGRLGTPLVLMPGDWVMRNAKGVAFKMTPEEFAAMHVSDVCAIHDFRLADAVVIERMG